jgi:hypothetical protein
VLGYQLLVLVLAATLLVEVVQEQVDQLLWVV